MKDLRDATLKEINQLKIEENKKSSKEIKKKLTEITTSFNEKADKTLNEAAKECGKSVKLSAIEMLRLAQNPGDTEDDITQNQQCAVNDVMALLGIKMAAVRKVVNASSALTGN